MSGIDADPKRSGPYRAALAAVILLSALMVAAVLAVVAGFIHQYRLYREDRDPGQAAASLQLAPGAHILSAHAEGGKLLLHVQTPQGSEVDVIDLVSGKLTARVKDSVP